MPTVSPVWRIICTIFDMPSAHGMFLVSWRRPRDSRFFILGRGLLLSVQLPEHKLCGPIHPPLRQYFAKSSPAASLSWGSLRQRLNHGIEERLRGTGVTGSNSRIASHVFSAFLRILAEALLRRPPRSFALDSYSPRRFQTNSLQWTSGKNSSAS